MASSTRSNLFNQDSIFSSLRLQSKFDIKEQQELLDKNETAFLRRIDIKKHRNNNNIYTITGFIIINNKELSFSHNLKISNISNIGLIGRTHYIQDLKNI